jgi:tetratricopeptide (TPR) repeat protein
MIRTRAVHVDSTLACVMCLALAAFAPAATAQEQDEAFKDGLDARESRKWQEAAEQMRRAIQADPKESSRKVRTGIFGGTEYLPFYFLGEALFNQGDCARAIEAWSVSEQQGAITSRSESVAFVRKGYAACEAKGVLAPARYGPLLSRTRQQVAEATTLAGNVSTAGQAHLELWRPDMKEQYERASGELQNAQSRLVTATRTRAERDFNDAASAAERARTAFKSLDSQLNAAISLHGTLQGIVKEIEQVLASVEANDNVLAKKRASMTPALAAARQTAQETMQRARSQMATGVRTSSVSALTEARASAEDASVKYREVLAAVTKLETRTHERRVAEALTLAQEAFSFVDGGLASLDRLAAEKPAAVTPEMTGQREALQKEVSTARRRFEAARRAGDPAGLEEAARLVTDVRTRLDALISAFGPVTLIDRGVRSALIEGARFFFAGDHQQALATLDPSTVGDGALQLHVHLLRAAAHYALYIRSGEKDRSHQSQAIAEIEKVKALNPDFEPDGRAFAPRFIAFFRTGHAAAAQAPTSQER